MRVATWLLMETILDRLSEFPIHKSSVFLKSGIYLNRFLEAKMLLSMIWLIYITLKMHTAYTMNLMKVRDPRTSLGEIRFPRAKSKSYPELKFKYTMEYLLWFDRSPISIWKTLFELWWWTLSVYCRLEWFWNILSHESNAARVELLFIGWRINIWIDISGIIWA